MRRPGASTAIGLASVAIVLAAALLSSGCERDLRPGLLLGLRHTEPGQVRGEPDRDVYRTLFLERVLERDGAAVRLTAEWPELLVKRGDGMRRLPTERYGSPYAFFDRLWISPALARPAADQPGNDVQVLPAGEPNRAATYGDPPGECPKVYRVTVLFANQHVVSTEIDLEDCGQIILRPYDQLRVAAMSGDASVRFSSVRELGGLWPLEQAARAFLEQALARGVQDLDCVAREANDLNWGIVRREGRWVLRGRLSAPVSVRCLNRKFDFDVAAEAPAALVGYDELQPAWSVVQAAVPDATDAFSSPDRGLLVVVTPRALLAFHPNGDALGGPVATIPLARPEVAVSAQWLRGDDVRRWVKALGKIPCPPPLICP